MPSSLSVNTILEECLRLRRSSQYLHISRLHLEYLLLVLDSRGSLIKTDKERTPVFHFNRLPPPTYPLRPVNTNNTSAFRITAAAGTKLASAFIHQEGDGISYTHLPL